MAAPDARDRQPLKAAPGPSAVNHRRQGRRPAPVGAPGRSASTSARRRPGP